MNESDLEERWRLLLTDGHQRFVSNRPLFKHLPSPPRCKLCAAPFAGLGGFLLRPAGLRPWEKNPSLCRRCITTLEDQGAGGAEIECVGDTVNSAARLASEATEGEVLVSEDALAMAGVDSDGLEQRVLALRGRSAPLAVRVARVGSLPASPVSDVRAGH